MCFLIKKFNHKLKIWYILEDIFFKYWYNNILNDIYFEILRWHYIGLTWANLPNFQIGSWD